VIGSHPHVTQETAQYKGRSDGAVPNGVVYAGEDILATKVEVKTAFMS
jgi:hypothetical protein